MKNFFSAAIIATLSLCTLDAVSALSAKAQLRYVNGTTYTATDGQGRRHLITREYTDIEGDTLVRVLVPGVGEELYWVDCKSDVIAFASESAKWSYVNHDLMEGYYSDVACRL